jgi:hypothetical protein
VWHPVYRTSGNVSGVNNNGDHELGEDGERLWGDTCLGSLRGGSTRDKQCIWHSLGSRRDLQPSVQERSDDGKEMKKGELWLATDACG